MSLIFHVLFNLLLNYLHLPLHSQDVPLHPQPPLVVALHRLAEEVLLFVFLVLSVPN